MARDGHRKISRDVNHFAGNGKSYRRQDGAAMVRHRSACPSACSWYDYSRNNQVGRTCHHPYRNSPTQPNLNMSGRICQELLPAQGEWSQDEYLVLTEHSSRLVEYTDGFLKHCPCLWTSTKVCSNFYCSPSVRMSRPGWQGPVRALAATDPPGQVPRARPPALAFGRRSTPPKPLLAGGSISL